MIDNRLNRLMELGFVRNDCEKALKAACFNIDRAVEYLIS